VVRWAHCRMTLSKIPQFKYCKQKFSDLVSEQNALGKWMLKL